MKLCQKKAREYTVYRLLLLTAPLILNHYRAEKGLLVE